MRYRIQHGYVQFGADVILENIDFEIHDREKIASRKKRLWEDYFIKAHCRRHFREQPGQR